MVFVSPTLNFLPPVTIFKNGRMHGSHPMVMANSTFSVCTLYRMNGIRLITADEHGNTLQDMLPECEGVSASDWVPKESLWTVVASLHLCS